MNLEDIPGIRKQFQDLEDRERQIYEDIKHGRAETKERRNIKYPYIDPIIEYPQLTSITNERRELALKLFDTDLRIGYDDWEEDPQQMLDWIEHFLKYDSA